MYKKNCYKSSIFIRLLVIMLLTLEALHPCFAKRYPIQLGDTTVTIVREQYGKGKSFIHVHQNETTALEAARTIIQHQGGSVITLQHPGGRNISFWLHRKQYEFDPNRIFTDQGIYKTLNDYGEYSKEAHTAVKRLATQILHLLPKGKIIAVHNNENFSLHDFLPGQPMAHEARDLYSNQQHHYRNFFIVTQKKDFQRLKALNFNSIWQAKSATDDGSLSVRLTKRTYVNVEAGYDQLTSQITMLKHA